MTTAWTDPFPRLPLELSTTIFHLVILNDFTFPRRPFDPPAVLPLSQVCRTWRTLIYSTPVFWNMLRLHDPTLPVFMPAPPSTKQGVKAPVLNLVDGFANQLSKWIKNSKSAPFYLKLTFPKGLYGSRLMTALLSPPTRASRFYHLDLTIRTSFQGFESLPLLASELQHRFPLLGYFRLRMLRRDSPVAAGVGGFVTYNPDKSWGAVAPYSRGWNGSQVQRLTKLHLEVVITPEQARKILLDASPCLVECTIEVVEDTRSPSGDLPYIPGTLPCLKAFNLTTYTSTAFVLLDLEMPDLERLTLRGRKEEHNESSVGQRALNEKALRRRILRRLAASSIALKFVTFETVLMLGKDDIFLFVRSSSSLSHLTLVDMPGLAQNYQAFFTEFVPREQESSLESLHISLAMSDFRFDIPQTFPTQSFVRFVVDHGHQMDISLQLVESQDDSGHSARVLKREIKAELARCGVGKDIWPKLRVGGDGGQRKGSTSPMSSFMYD
ncbi:hypothetical protein BKA70DRAFT_1559144 [Coprinopsis sp. MPI-PUGE-AT-0042]|nr:hypothetical protein BKA70DRAFT_1559144 [Coprinopsis sp. MPI-PUGE-AT-0042]